MRVWRFSSSLLLLPYRNAECRLEGSRSTHDEDKGQRRWISQTPDAAPFVSTTSPPLSSEKGKVVEKQKSSSTTTAVPGSSSPQPSSNLTRKRDLVLSTRITVEKMKSLFLPSQRQQFPRWYRPSSGVASFLLPQGIPLEEIVSCYRSLVAFHHHAGTVDPRGGKQEVEAIQPSRTEESEEAVKDSRSLRQDFAADHVLWSRAALEDYLTEHVLLPQMGGGGRERETTGKDPGRPRRGGTAADSSSSSIEGQVARQRKWFRQWTSRQVLLPDATVRRLFSLGPYLPPPPEEEQGHPARTRSSDGTSSSSANVASFTAGEKKMRDTEKSSPRPPSLSQYLSYYHFTPHAVLQEIAMRPISMCRSPQDMVHLTTFSQLFNLFHQEFCSFSPLQTLSHYSTDALVFTQEFIFHLASYLRKTVEEIVQQEPQFVRQAAASSIENGAPTSSSVSHYPSSPADAPILLFFGNGRLAHELNASGLLHPRKVLSVRLPFQTAAATKALQLGRQEMQKETSVLPQAEAFRSLVHPQFTSPSSALFPCETIPSVQAALQRYRPSVVVVEPHRGSRDYLADLRGFHTVRRVVALGPVDGPGMGSAWFPFLSFGVTPSPYTYLVYNEWMQQVTAATRIKMPVDPPHELQGYVKRYLDKEISSWLIAPNDVAAVPNQYRALVFERVACPARRSASNPTSCKE